MLKKKKEKRKEKKEIKIQKQERGEVARLSLSGFGYEFV